MTWLVLKEMLVGGAFAFAVGGARRRAERRGLAPRHLIGFSFGSLVDPLTGTQSTVLAQAYALVGMLIFIAIGGDGWVIQGLARTYDLVAARPGAGTSAPRRRRRAAFGSIFVSAIEVAAPVLLALILTDAAFGVVSRVVPQLNVFAVGFPAKVVVGLLLVGATLPFVAGWIGDELQQDVGRRPPSAQGGADGRRARPRRQHPRSARKPARRARSRARRTSTAPSSCIAGICRARLRRARRSSQRMGDAMRGAILADRRRPTSSPRRASASCS